MDTYAIQVKLSNSNWYWLEHNQFGVGYLTASKAVNSETVWLDSKFDATQFILDCNIKSGSEILILGQGGNDLSQEIESVRIVKIEPVEV